MPAAAQSDPDFTMRFDIGEQVKIRICSSNEHEVKMPTTDTQRIVVDEPQHWRGVVVGLVGERPSERLVRFQVWLPSCQLESYSENQSDNDNTLPSDAPVCEPDEEPIAADNDFARTPLAPIDSTQSCPTEQRFVEEMNHVGVGAIQQVSNVATTDSPDPDGQKSIGYSTTTPSRAMHECVECGQRVRTKRLLRLHTASHYRPVEKCRKYTRSGVIKCHRCESQFQNNEAFRRHFTERHGELSLACLLCGCCFGHFNTLRRHCNKHHPEIQNQVAGSTYRPVDLDRTVVIGLRKMRRWFDFQDFKNSDISKALLFSCKSCNIRVASVHTLLQHRRCAHHEQLTMKCDDCGAQLKTNETLAYHCFGRHSGQKPLACPSCAKRFTTRQNFTNHVLRVHAMHTKRLECEECGRKFRQNKDKLQTHLDTHSMTKRHQCEICGKRHYTFEKLTHCRLQHSRGERPWECENCGKRFNTTGNLRNHVRIHSGLKPFICSTCGNAFRTVGNLINHERTHTLPAPCASFRCPTCRRNFRSATELRRHRRKWHGEEDDTVFLLATSTPVGQAKSTINP